MMQPALDFCQTPIGALLLVFTFLAAWAGWYPLKRWKYRHFKGPFGLPFLGNLPQIVSMDMTAYLEYVARKYGSVCKIWFGTRPWIVISDPDILRKLAFSCTSRPDLDTYLHVLTGENRHVDHAGVLFAEGEAWRRCRRVFEASIIHPARLAAHLPTIYRRLRCWLPLLDDAAAEGREVEVCGPLGKLMLAMVGEIAYGVDFSSGYGSDLAAACRDIFDTMHMEEATVYLPLQLMFPSCQPLIRFLAHHLPDAKQRRTMAARSKLAAVSRAIMQQWQAGTEAAAAAEQANGVEGSEGKKGQRVAQGKGVKKKWVEVGGGISASSFMAAMMEDRQGTTGTQRLSEVEVVAQGFTFIAAGFETTSTTLATALFLMAGHPAVQQRAAAEVAALGNRELSVEVLADELPYINAVVRETMRLYPAGSVLSRRAKSDIDLGGGQMAPRGSFLALANHALQHDPAMWPQPTAFLPQRHLPESGGALGPANPSAWAAFGLGARMCVGHKLATLVTQATLVTLIRRYSFRLAPCQRLPLRTRTGLTYGPADGVWLMVERRAE